MRAITARERGELESRAFYGEATWKAWKADYDEMMSYRKTIKGKPDTEQQLILALNKVFIAFYEDVLFHSAFLAIDEKCVCARCIRTLQLKPKEKMA